jgi:hypothetical protein
MKNTVLLLITLISLPVAAQNSGFFGKTSFVEITGIGNYPLFSNMQQENNFYKKSGNGLATGQDAANGGVYFAVGTAVKRNVALTLETGFWWFNMLGPNNVFFEDSYYGYMAQVPIRHENLAVRTFSVMPIVEIGGKKGLLPIGISHQIGMGYTSSRIAEKDYVYEPGTSGEYTYYDDQTGYHTVTYAHLIDSLHTQQGGFADYGKKRSGVTLLYGLKVRTPITKSILINYGLRYTLNIGGKSDSNQYGEYDREAWTTNEIRRTRFRSLVSLNLGLTYVF